MDRGPSLKGFCGTSSFMPNQGCRKRAEGTLLLAWKAEDLRLLGPLFSPSPAAFPGRSRGAGETPLPISPLVHRSETSSVERVDTHLPAKLPNGLMSTHPPRRGGGGQQHLLSPQSAIPSRLAAPLAALHTPGRAGLPFRLLSPSRNFRYFSVFICCFQLEGAATMAQRVEEPAKPPSPATACPALNPRHPVRLPFAPSPPAEPPSWRWPALCFLI